MSAVLWSIQQAHALSLTTSSRAWRRALALPQQAQYQRWKALIRQNAQTAYGRAMRFEHINSIAQFQDRVPVVDYDALRPWVDRIAQGEQGVLTQASVLMLEPTGGSTSVCKFIPYTAELLADFSRATNPWLADLYQHVEGLKGTQSYWSISLAKQGERATAGGVRIGFDDDTEYFGPLTRWALNRMMAVPQSVAQAPDMQTWRHLTCLHLLRAESLGLISVWSPTYLSLLMDYIRVHLTELLADLPAQRRQAIEQGISRAGRITGRALWPKLKLISCWTDSIAAAFMPELRQWFPGIAVQGKGLLATEGVVSVPVWGRTDGCALAVNSHFLEFIDLDHPHARPLLAHQLKAGGQYSPIMTTSGGLYRYHLKDAVSCVGHVSQTPLIRFDGKLDRVSDLCGEKIHASQVERAFEEAQRKLGVSWRFALLSPVMGQPSHYRLFIDSDAHSDLLGQVAALIEGHLHQGHHYATCRRLGQLSAIQVQAVCNGWQIFQQTLVNAGQRAGDIKPTVLDARHDWLKVFSVA
ncbi:MAG TPA: GH3 auxin-responsive promoter family protein [Aquabacterium sp.]|nr:GH3 auxin-responsive promoter family protein [Aquabacterium sp.]